MKMHNIIIISLISMIPFGFVGLIVEGLPGLKLALGIVAMFAMSAAVLGYALNGVEEQTKAQQ
jgi:hypothetical protein